MLYASKNPLFQYHLWDKGDMYIDIHQSFFSLVKVKQLDNPWFNDGLIILSIILQNFEPPDYQTSYYPGCIAAVIASCRHEILIVLQYGFHDLTISNSWSSISLIYLLLLE